jgi:hypothetical protein
MREAQNFRVSITSHCQPILPISLQQTRSLIIRTSLQHCSHVNLSSGGKNPHLHINPKRGADISVKVTPEGRTIFRWKFKSPKIISSSVLFAINFVCLFWKSTKPIPSNTVRYSKLKILFLLLSFHPQSTCLPQVSQEMSSEALSSKPDLS